jgi:hypothetical protein
VWKRIKDIISRRKHKARNRVDFIEVLREKEAQIDREFLLKLCASMPARYRACLKNGGGATKY